MAAPPGTRPRPRSQRRPTSFRTTLLLWSLVLALVPTVLMAAQGFHCAREAVTEAVTSDLRHVAAARASQLSEWLKGRRMELEFLVQSLSLPPGCQASCICEGLPQPDRKAVDLLEPIMDQLPGSSGVAVLSVSGELLGSHGQFPDGWQALVAPMVREEMRAQTVPPAAQILGEDSRSLLLVGLLKLQDRPASGYLVASLDVEDSLTRILSDRTGLGSSGTAVLSRGRDKPGVGPGELLDSTDRGAGIWRNRAGDQVVGGFSRIPELSAVLIVERETTEALLWLAILARRAIVVGLVTALFVLLFSRFVARRQSGPLKTLADVARKITSGDHLARVPALSGLELEEVGRAYNNMLDALQRSRERLAQGAALAAVGELSTSIVHELRNPLSSVKMNLQALSRKLRGDAILTEQAQIATQQAGRIEQMLEDLLDYNKPVSCAPRSVPLNEIVSYVSGSVSGSLQQRNIRLRVAGPEGQEVLETDPERLAQALENLLRNAIEASPEGGEVQLGVEVLNEESGQVVFEIADQGSGLPQNGRDRLFQPFFSSKVGGTGLGLANVKKIVELLGGTVQADDRPEGGAVFKIFLPWTPRETRRAGT